MRTTIVEPGGYWTDLYLSGLRATTPHPDYADLRADLERQFAEGSNDSMPELAVDTTTRRLATWAEWEQVSRAAEHAVPPPSGYGMAAG